MNTLDRRSLLRFGFGGMLAAPALRDFAPLHSFATAAASAPPANGVDKLLLIFLRGGNDFVNCVVPVGDDSYTRTRKKTGSQAWIDPNTTKAILGSTYARLNPALAELAETVGSPDASGHMAWIHQVGLFANPTRSHFDAMLRIETADASGPAGLKEGWIPRLVDKGGFDGDFASVCFSPLIQRSFRTPNNQQLHLRSWDDFKAKDLDQALLSHLAGTPTPTAEALVNRVGDKLYAAHALVKQVVYPVPPPAPPDATGLPPSDAGQRFLDQVFDARRALTLTPCRVVGIELGGFDTHGNQIPTHDLLLRYLARAMRYIYDATINSGTLRLLTVVVSEFGRTAAVNGGNGTDHGWGGGGIAMGSGVRAGVYHCAAQPSTTFGAPWTKLNQLPGKDSPTPNANAVNVVTDYSAIFREICEKRFGVGNTLDLLHVLPGMASGSQYVPINFLL